MKLIIGGAYQGKLAYAKEHYGIEERGIFRTGDEINIDFSKQVIADVHLLILNQIKAGMDPLGYINGNIEALKNKIIICQDISCGIVPTDPIMRKWRESVGHCLAALVKESDEVVRVFCGLGTRLK